MMHDEIILFYLTRFTFHVSHTHEHEQEQEQEHKYKHKLVTSSE